jgi:hypothetical protein
LSSRTFSLFYIELLLLGGENRNLKRKKKKIENCV